VTNKVRLGLMGFGRIGRQVYDLASRSNDIEVAVIADIGRPDILHYLLTAEVPNPEQHNLQGNFLVNPNFSARMSPIDRPQEIPWDLFEVDAVLDCTGKHRDAASMQAHLDNGARRVLIRTLPLDHVDRIVIPGINQDAIRREDRLLSAGSSTTNALCLLLHMAAKDFAIDCVSMTSIHAYTSDQSLQDYAGRDFRRSRSAAENIIPNTHEAEKWIAAILPQFAGKVMTNVLNVPIHAGCMLDVNLVLQDAGVDAEAFNAAIREAIPAYPGIVDLTEDPIVSSDVIGSTLSLLYDTQATEKAGKHTIKAIGWHENLGHAARLLDVVRLYAALDAQPMGNAKAGTVS
jgi:glyceraldehyde 3-phosphate dehydrogenase